MTTGDIGDDGTTTRLPTYRDFLVPVLQALDNAHGSATKQEVDDAVIDLLPVTPAQMAVTYPPGSTAKGSKVRHRIAFARSSLKLCGALDNPQRGIWTLTAAGRDLLLRGEDAIYAADARVRKELAEARAAKASADTTTEPVEDAEPELAEGSTESAEISWREQLLDRVQSLSPDAFERLCARLLRMAGCRSVEVTRRSGDEGIDGVGVLEFSLLSFPVFFQAKRYRKEVGPAVIRELRGAMAGRGDKGILITSGRFTSGARQEAGRPGAAPVDLVDGERLCDLLLTHGLGVDVLPVIDEQFFEDL